MSRNLETATSLDRFLNRSVLFVQGIDQTAPKQEVLQVLNQVLKAPQQGRIDILTTSDGKNRGTAFLNFHNKEDAAAALDKWRFTLELRGRPLRMQFSSDREFKDLIQGPGMSRFKIIVRNLPEELGPEEMFEKYSKFGEILQLHYTHDPSYQYYAIIQYVEASAAAAAIRSTNRERVFNQVLMVEQFRSNVTYAPIPKGFNNQQQPAAGGGAAAAGSSAGGAGGAGGSAPLQGMTYAALQQQQEREAAEAAEAAAVAAAAEAAQAEAAYYASYGEGSGAAAGGGAAEASTSSLAVPSFYAAAPAGPAPATATGSLLSLLTTALNQAQMLEDLLCCPITQEPLRDPVIAADGNTYERSAIEAWLRNHDTSPLTNQALPNKLLIPNNLIRKLMDDLKGTGDASNGGGAAAASAPSSAVPATPAEAAPTPAVSYDGVAAAETVQLTVPVPVPAVPVPVAAAPAAAAAHQHQPAAPTEVTHASYDHASYDPAAYQQQTHQQTHQQAQPQQQYVAYVPQPVHLGARPAVVPMVAAVQPAVHHHAAHHVQHHATQQQQQQALAQQQQHLQQLFAQQQAQQTQQQAQQQQAQQQYATYTHGGTTYYYT